MSTPGFMFHKNRPEGQMFPDLPVMQATLEAEGWVDTPAKLDPEYREPAGNTMSAGEPLPPVAFAANEGRVLNTDPTSTPHAAGRYDRLFDKDGADISDLLEDVDLVRLVDDMSREEIAAALRNLTAADADNDPTKLASVMRKDLVDLLRPGLDISNLEFGTSQEGQTEPASDDTSRTEPGKSAEPEDVAKQEDEASKQTLEPETPDVQSVTLERLRAMPEDAREVWMGKATRNDLTAKLDELQVTYKARDGKEELQEALRAKLAEPSPT